MLNYKILVFDDEYGARKDTYEGFFSKAIPKECLNGNSVPIFDIVPENNYQTTRKKLEKWEFDAIFMDAVFGKDDPNELDVSILENYLYSIKDYYNVKGDRIPPIFVVSSKWCDSNLARINKAFMKVFHSLPLSYYSFSDLSQWANEPDIADMDGNFSADSLIAERKNIYDIISLHNERTTKFLQNDEDIVILHISDLQFGDRKSTDNFIGMYDNINDKIKSIRGKSSIDLVVISGDIAMGGKANEFEVAKEPLMDFFGKLWPNEKKKEWQERIILVPGNHDFDINFCIADLFKAKNQEHARSIDLYDVIKQIGGEISLYDYSKYGLSSFRNFGFYMTEDLNFHVSPYLNYINNRFLPWGIRFAVLNSVSNINWMKTNQAGFSKEDIDSMVKKEGGKNNIFTIAVSHHSPLLLEEKDNQLTDEETDNLKTVINSLVRPPFKCQMFLGGHRHMNDQKDNKDSKGDKYISIEAASLRVEEKSPKYVRGFNVIQLKREAGSVKAIEEHRFQFDKDDANIKEDEPIMHFL